MRTLLACLPPTLLLTAGLTSQRVTEVEPNGAVAQAQPITAGRQVVANLRRGRAGLVQLHAGRCGRSAPADVGQLRRQPERRHRGVPVRRGTTRLAWNDNQRGNHSDCGVNLPAGAYTCMVLGKTGTVAGDYNFDFSVLAPAVVQVLEGAEPNGDPAPAGVPTQITLGDTITGDLSSPLDSDWYTFSLARAGIVQAASTTTAACRSSTTR